jgi:hypothetical protein
MPLTAAQFLERLRSLVPETEPTVHEHLLENYGELLLHLLTADLRRLAIAWFSEARDEPLHRLLDVVATGLREGDDHVRDAMAVSFVEDTGWWEPEMHPFIATWPAGLAHELARQRASG